MMNFFGFCRNVPFSSEQKFSYLWIINTISAKPVLTLNFSGYEWYIKDTQNQVGPGPNYFSSDHVWVDANGNLHLKIAYKNGKWYCAEVYTKKSFGYGIYNFYIIGKIDSLPVNVVLGLFVYDDSPAYSHREIDIEFSRWGYVNNQNSQYVIQPWNDNHHLYRFHTILNGLYSTHSFTWLQDQVEFRSIHGHYSTPPNSNYIIQTWNYIASDVPPKGNEKVHINLWLYGGNTPEREVEVIISRFEFQSNYTKYRLTN